jgi:hypothetical protein
VADKDEVLWKALATGASIVAAMAARNLATASWQKAAGGDPPTNPADPKTSWSEAIGWTVLVGVLAGVARLVARRSAAEVWESWQGELPPGMNEVDA